MSRLSVALQRRDTSSRDFQKALNKFVGSLDLRDRLTELVSLLQTPTRRLSAYISQLESGYNTEKEADNAIKKAISELRAITQSVEIAVREWHEKQTIVRIEEQFLINPNFSNTKSRVFIHSGECLL